MDVVESIQINESISDSANAFDCIQFSHEELMELTTEAINKLITSDPLLKGLPCDPTVEEIKAQTAVAQGQAITLYLSRENLPKLSIVVPPHKTTVLDLKKAIKRQTDLSLHREKIVKKISWRHVWKKYHLCCNEVILIEENETIRNYGISNRAELKYMKKRREKNRVMNTI